MVMLKRSLCLVLIVFTLLFIGIIPTILADAGTPIVQIGNVTGSAGSEVTVPVTISTIPPGWVSLDLTLEFDTNVLEVISVNNGDVFSSSTRNFSNDTGKVLVAAATDFPITSGSTLIEIVFKIKETAKLGESQLIQEELILGDSSFMPIPVTAENGSVNVISLVPSVSATPGATFDGIQIEIGKDEYLYKTKNGIFPVEASVEFVEGTDPVVVRAGFGQIDTETVDWNTWGTQLTLSNGKYIGDLTIPDNEQQILSVIAVAEKDEQYYVGAFPGETAAYVQLDTEGPFGTVLINNDAETTHSKQVQLEITCNAADLEKYEISNDQQTWESYYAPVQNPIVWELADGTDGERTVYVKLVDDLGNATIVHDSINIDTQTGITNDLPEGKYFTGEEKSVKLGKYPEIGELKYHIYNTPDEVPGTITIANLTETYNQEILITDDSVLVVGLIIDGELALTKTYHYEFIDLVPPGVEPEPGTSPFKAPIDISLINPFANESNLRSSVEILYKWDGEGDNSFKPYTSSASDLIKRKNDGKLIVRLSVSEELFAEKSYDYDFDLSIFDLVQEAYQSGAIQKMTALDYADFEFLLGLTEKFIDARNEILTPDERTRLVGNGVTEETINNFLQAVTGENGIIADEDDYEEFVSAIGEERFIDRAGKRGLITFYSELKDAFDTNLPTLKAKLTENSLGFSDLFFTALELINVPINPLDVTLDMREDVDQVLASNIYPKISKERLSANGINWANYQKMINKLTAEEKTQIAALFEKLALYVQMPELSPSGPQAGTYYKTIKVLFASTTGDIYYTLDGTEPSTASTKYSAAVGITLTPRDADWVIKAIRVVNGEQSPVATFTFSVKAAVAAPTADLNPDITYYAPQTVHLTGPEGALIYYTTNGTVPSATNGTLYQEGIPLSTSTVLKAVAVIDGVSSPVATFEYKFAVLLAPTANPVPGTYLAETSVTLLTATPNAQIYYTWTKDPAVSLTDPDNTSTLYSTPLVVAPGEVLKLKAVAYSNGTYSQVSTFQYEVLAQPTANPASLATPGFVRLETPNTGALIYYTTNGADPTPQVGKIYLGKIWIANDTVLKAIAVKNGVVTQTATYNYQFDKGSITGTIKDLHGNVLSGIQVTLAGTTRSATSDQNGSYSFTDVLAGTYQVVVNNQMGYAGQTVGGVTVASGSATVLDFVLIKGGNYKGKVVDKNNNPVADATVSISSTGKTGEGYYATGTTDDNGLFWLEGLKQADDYAVEISHPDYLSETLPVGTINYGQVKDDINNPIQLEKYEDTLGSIAGTVKDTNGDNVNGVMVSMWSYSTGVYKQTTSANGSYTIDGLKPANDYVLTAYDYETGRYYTKTVVISKAVTTTENIVLEAMVSITGTVTHGGNGLSGVEISAWSPNGGWGYTTSDADGEFTLVNLIPGDYTISYIPADRRYAPKEESVTINSDITDHAVSLDQGGTITGYLVDSEGSVEGAEVTVWQDSGAGWARTVTKADGSFEISGLPAGDYNLTVWKAGTILYRYFETIPVADVKLNETKDVGTLTLVREDALPGFSGSGNSVEVLSESYVEPGKIAKFRVNFKNNGANPLTNGRIEINLPQGATYVANSARVTVNNVTCGNVATAGNKIVITNLNEIAATINGSVVFEVLADASFTGDRLVITANIGDGSDSQSLGNASVEVFLTNINAPSIAKVGENIVVYGSAAKNATIKVYGKKSNDTTYRLLATKAAEGKWWSADISFAAAGNYNLYAVATVTVGGNVIVQRTGEITVKVEEEPVIITNIRVQAGWNGWVNSNSRVGFPTLAVSQGNMVNLEAIFENQPQNVKLLISDNQGLWDGTDVNLNLESTSGNEYTYTGSFRISYSASGVKNLILTYTDASGEIKQTAAKFIILIDPSGYVYDASSPNTRLSDVRAECQVWVPANDGAENADPRVRGAQGKWTFWDAALYGQVNPQFTDNDGKYGWDVPAGFYRVIFTKSGYQAYTSEVVQVPPPKTDLNVGIVSLLSLTAPEVQVRTPDVDESGVSIDQSVTVTFSKAMDAVTINNSTFKVKNADLGTYVSGNVTYNAETKTATFNPDDNLAFETLYTVELTGIEDTFGNSLTTSWNFVTVAQVTNVSVNTNPGYWSDSPSPVTISGTIWVDGLVAAGTVDVSVTRPDGTIDNIDRAEINDNNADGSYTAQYTLPQNAPEGVYTVTVTLTSNGANYTSTFYVVDISLPTTSKAPGTYNSTQTVTISTATEGAVIYYTTDGSTPNAESAGGAQQQYTITVDKTMDIKAIAVKNGVSTTPVCFSYTINTGGSGGGGGGAGAPSKEAVISDSEVSKQLSAGKAEITFIAPKGSETIVIDAKTYNRIADAKKDLVIVTDEVTFRIPAGTFAVTGSTKIKISVETLSARNAGEILKKAGSDFAAVGDVFEITSSEDLKKGIQVTIFYEEDLVVNEDNLDAYWYNEATGAWVAMNGKVNKNNNSITFTTTHFSRYTILEFKGTFADIVNHWAREDIEFMVSKNVIKGISSSEFAPNALITRAQFAALLVRALGLDAEPDYQMTFGDVAKSQWYYGEVAAAFKAGIIKGLSADVFAPNANITREQMAAMMARAMETAGVTVEMTEEAAQIELSRFKDQGEIASWAKVDVAKAVKMGIIKGRTEDTFVAKANATRAESAVMIKRMYEQIH